MRTSIRKLRSDTKAILKAVERGIVVFVTNRGKVCAKIVPHKPEKKNKETHRLFGMWDTNKEVESVNTYIDNIRKPRHAR